MAGCFILNVKMTSVQYPFKKILDTLQKVFYQLSLVIIILVLKT